MTLKETKILHIIKNEILYDLDLSILSNSKLLEILIDIDDFDIDTISDTEKDFIYEDVEAYIDREKGLLGLEKLLAYVDKKDYDLDNLLLFTPYDANNLDFNTLSNDNINYIKDELELSIDLLEHEVELERITDELKEKELYEEELQKLYNEECFNTQYPETICDYTEQENYNIVHREIEQLRDEKDSILEELQYMKENHKKIDTEARIKMIQAKKYISPKELSILYPDMSISSQATYRGRLKDKLPYQQKKKRGKITYIVSEIEVWRENQNWKHL